jgi:CheY-like chemotaxis protein
MFEADPHQIEQVLLNLDINAAEAVPDRGRISIIAQHQTLSEPQTLGDITVPPGSYVLLVVADNGPGILPEDAPHIFEPFFTTKGLATHSGLGLAAAHGIIEAHAGHIGFTTSSDEATAFEVYLPVSSEAGEPNQPAPWPRKGALLVIDADQALAALACGLLQHLGHQCTTAADLDGCMPLLTERPSGIAMVLVDPDLPGTDGADILTSLAQVAPGLPVIAMTDSELDADRQEHVAEYTSVILHKLFGVDEVAKLVKAVLEQQ